ncbi:MAG: type II secretion system F family protein [Candidatus Omnitrophica bacterium]|nr:type II secretion system F family protein [Candidatus Omnitrophota bacterium]
MTKFIYKVRDRQGKLLTGTLEAEDKRALVRRLSDYGYFVVYVKKFPTQISWIGQKIPLDAVILFSHKLSSMISAGIPILRCLHILWEQTEDKGMQLVISEIENDLEKGASLSTALKRFPEVFSPIYINLIEVAERGGVLAEILKKIVVFLERQRELQMRMKKALTYPTIILGIAVFVFVLMMFFVVPVFRGVFAKLNVSLPLFTQGILAVSDFFRTCWWSIPVIAIVMIFWYRRYDRTESGRYRIDVCKLQIPIIGDLILTAALARFTYAFSLLVVGGVPLVYSIESAKKSAANKVIEAKFDYIKEKIIHGGSLSEAMAATKFFPSFLTEMIAIGEESGTLGDMLKIVGVHMDEEVDYRINKFVTMVEPIAIVLIGIIVAAILIALYSPVFTLWGRLEG